MREYDAAVPMLRDGHLGALALALAGRAVIRQRAGDGAGALEDIDEGLRAWDRHAGATSVVRINTLQAAADVAGYVAQVAAVPGQDTGALASAVQSVAQKVAVEQNGILQIDADPTGQLKFLASGATAKAGSVTLRMKNASSVPHDIAIQGPGGLNQIGAIVQNGGVSTVTATLKPGSYTFYCSVDGHRAACMGGTVVVK